MFSISMSVIYYLHYVYISPFRNYDVICYYMWPFCNISLLEADHMLRPKHVAITFIYELVQ